MSQREVVFLVADSGMEQLLRGFLGRAQFHRSLGCAPFDFDPSEDIVVAPARDPDVYGKARQLLGPYRSRHRRAVAIVDAAWAGSPGAAAIRDHITEALKVDWEQYAVVVIDPELEAWVWQDNPHVAEALKCRADFRDVLRHADLWPADTPKPPDPKAAIEHLRRHHRADRSNAAFRRLAERVSVRGCVDPAFRTLCDTLRAWFPEG